MGKRSQRKKQLRAQHRRRESRKVVVHPASIPVKVRRDRKKPITLLSLPLEIRFEIFTALATGAHTITIAPNVHIYSPLTGLIYTHPQLEAEIAKWRKCHIRPAIHPVFGEFDLSLTTFKITFRSSEQRATHVYKPESARRNMLNLELWKRAMDLVGTNKQYQVNLAISYLTRNLWEWKPFMGRHKKDTPEFRRMQERLRFLVFDQGLHGNVHVVNSPRKYDEPFGKKPMRNIKATVSPRRASDSTNQLSCYYRSLGMKVDTPKLKELEWFEAPREFKEAEATKRKVVSRVKPRPIVFNTRPLSSISHRSYSTCGSTGMCTGVRAGLTAFAIGSSSLEGTSLAYPIEPSTSSPVTDNISANDGLYQSGLFYRIVAL